MKAQSVEIAKVDNGFILKELIIDRLEKTQEQKLSIFKTFEEVLEYLKPSESKIKSVK